MAENTSEEITFVNTTLTYVLSNVVPIQIFSVTGLLGGSEYNFVQGNDFILDGNNLVWGETTTSNKPDDNSLITVIYDFDPILLDLSFTEEQYGRDINLFENDLRGSNSGEVELVTFSKNLLESLKHRLLTQKGELFKHENYGSELHKLLGLNINQTSIELCRLYVVEALNQDPRIEELIEITITPNYSNRAFEISVIFTSIVNREELNLVYDYFLDAPDGYLYV